MGLRALEVWLTGSHSQRGEEMGRWAVADHGGSCSLPRNGELMGTDTSGWWYLRARFNLFIK